MTATLPNLFNVGEFQINRELNTILFNGESQIVEPKIMEVLYYLACRENQVISRQQLMDDLWPAPVSDGAISRVVGLLRKALGDSSDSPRYIQTIAKKGYRLIATVDIPVAVNNQKAALDDIDVKETNHKTALKPKSILPLMTTAVIAIVVVGIVVVGIVASIAAGLFINNDEPSFAINNPYFEQLTSEKGFEHDASLSKDEQWLVYRHRKDADLPYHLYLKRRDLQKTIQLTDSALDDRAPSFSSDKSQVVFFRKGNNRCQLNLLNLDQQGQPLSVKTLYQCGAVEHYSNVVWSQDNQSLYFTDRAKSTLPYQIYQLHLATGKVDEITRREDNYYGDNELALSPSGKQLLFFRNKYWGNNQVFIKDLQTGQQRKITELGFLSWTPSWTPDEQHILFSDNRTGGQLKLLNIHSGQIKTLYQSSQSINSPELSAGGNKIVYSTQTADVDLWQSALTDDIERPAAQPLSTLATNKLPFNSSRNDSQPVYSTDQQSLLFMSNRNGAAQLWLQTKEGLSVLDSLSEHMEIDVYVWHPDGIHIVVATADKRLYLVNSQNDTHQQIDLKGQTAAYPFYANDGNTLYFSSDKSGDWQLWALDTKNQSTSQITETGGYQGRISLTGDHLYFTKYRQKGIWQLDLLNQTTRLLIDDIHRSANFSVCANSLLYVLDNDNTELWQASLHSTKRQKLMTLAANARLKFDVADNCQRLVFSKWLNVESDIMMLNLSTP